MIYKVYARERITVSNSAVGLTVFSGYGTVTQNSGTVTGSPVTLASGSNTITFSGAGTANVKIYAGCSASAADGTATLTSSPTACKEGRTTAIDTGATTGTVIVTVTPVPRFSYSNIIYARIQCITADVRYCINGDDPVATNVGELLPYNTADRTVMIWGVDNLRNFKAIRDGGSDGYIEVTYFCR